MNISHPKSKGVLFLVVGNSGSGKDSVISGVIERWDCEHPKLFVPQRFITRPAHESEDFVSVSSAEFTQLKKENKLAFYWHIYDLDYGVPVEIFDWLSLGHFVLVNVSRKIIHAVKEQIPGTQIVFIKVPFEITKDRILQRGRENPDDPQFQARLKRAEQNQKLTDADIIIDNSGDLQKAIDQLYNQLHSLV